MKHVQRSVLLWYSPQEMHDLVTDVRRYPDFLPWCETAEVLEEHAHGMTARLMLAKAGLRHTFTTRNTHQRSPLEVRLALVDGPFSTLDGAWRFKPVSRAGDKACKVEFDLRYAFSNAALEALVAPVFDLIANTLVDSFVARAEQVHGPR
jgi:ribosome-associated toxin RatA of RatAB toxin-antitoxin module